VKAGWQTVRLDTVFDIARGGSPRPIDKFMTNDTDGLNWVKISDATASGKYIERTKERIKATGLSKTRQVFPGDFLLTNSMSFGRPYIMATSGCIHDGWLVLRPHDEKIVWREFFYHLLGSQAVYDRLAGRAAGSTVKNLNTDIVASIEIPLPPLDEQKRIAAILDKADALRAKRRQAIALLDSLTQSIFLEMFGDPVSNPRGYPIRELQEIVDPERKITYGILMPGPDVPDGIPYVRVVDIQGGAVLTQQLRRTTREIATEYRRSELKAGDLLISIRGHVGRMAIAPLECDGANITQDTARLAVTGADPHFVCAVLAAGSSQHWMDRRTKGVAVRGINLGDLKRFPVILPPADLQRQFAAKVEQQGWLVKKTLAQEIEAHALFASLQHRAFSGQL